MPLTGREPNILFGACQRVKREAEDLCARKVSIPSGRVSSPLLSLFTQNYIANLKAGGDKQDVATNYVCIVTTMPLPADIFITAKGQVLFNANQKPSPMPMPAPAAPSEGAIIDFTANRKKEFVGLTVGTRYYFTYFAINTTGVGALSTTFSIICG